MKRIAMLCIHSYPLGQLGSKDVGGMNVYVLEVARRLGELGFIVDIFTHPMSGYEDFTPYPNVHIIHLHSISMYLTKNEMAYYTTEMCDEIAEFMMRENISYDLVHSNYWVSALVGDLVSRRFHIPHVVMFHTLGLVKESFAVNGKETPLRAKYEKNLMNSASCVIVPDNSELEMMQNYYDYDNTNYEIIPCGVDLDVFYPIKRKGARNEIGMDAYDRLVLCVGRPEPMKGFDLAIKALSMVKSKVHMVIVGGSDEDAFTLKLKEMAKELKVLKNITFVNNVSHEELHKYYCASDIVLNSSYYASFSLVILEALASGTPVISTHTGIAPDVITFGANGILVETSPKGIATAIDDMFSKLDVRRYDKAALIDNMENYSWKKVAEKIMALYLRLIGD